MRAILTAIFAGVAVLAVAAPGEQTWRKIENKSFSFSVPPSFKKTDQSGIDSFVEEYVAEGIELSFDYGFYSNDFGEWPKETEFDSVKVDGRTARIGTAMREFHKGFPLSTQIHIKLEGGVSLSMFAACKTKKEVSLARKIFETIAFNAKKP